MSDPRKPLALLVALVSVLGPAGTRLSRAYEICDDFADGELYDGDPIAWNQLACFRPQVVELPGDGLVLGGNQAAVNVPTHRRFSGNMSVRVRMRLSSGGSHFLGVHGDYSGCGGYFAGIDPQTETVGILRQGRNLPRRPLGNADLANFDPSTDYIMQLDVVDLCVQVRVWKAGEEMPQEPQVKAEDASFREGTVSIGFIPLAPEDRAIYRYVWIREGLLGPEDELPPCERLAVDEEACENFADGNLFDDDPLSWNNTCVRPSVVEFNDGGLVLGNNRAGFVGITTTRVFEGNVSVRARLRANGGAVYFVGAHNGAGGCVGYYGGIDAEGGAAITRQGADAGVVRLAYAKNTVDFVDGADYILQLDVAGSSVEFRAWKDGQPVPPEPQVSAEDMTFRAGTVVVGFEALVPEDRTTFQNVWIRDDFLREDEPFPCARAAFLRGDCNDDGDVDISDGVCILNWLFLGGEAPGCAAVTNINGDDETNVADPSFLFNFLFLGGPPPAAPFPDCGPLEGCKEAAGDCR